MTSRQQECLLLVMRGLRYKQVARRLGLSDNTVRSHLTMAYERLGVNDCRQAMVVMLRNGWTSLAELPDYTGPLYSTLSQRGKSVNWVPSPAQRLYLDAFDLLLRQRTAKAAELVSFYFGVMCRERGCPDRRVGQQSVDALLMRLGRAVSRRIPLDEAA